MLTSGNAAKDPENQPKTTMHCSSVTAVQPFSPQFSRVILLQLVLKFFTNGLRKRLTYGFQSFSTFVKVPYLSTRSKKKTFRHNRDVYIFNANNMSFSVFLNSKNYGTLAKTSRSRKGLPRIRAFVIFQVPYFSSIFQYISTPRGKTKIRPFSGWLYFEPEHLCFSFSF